MTAMRTVLANLVDLAELLLILFRSSEWLQTQQLS